MSAWLGQEGTTCTQKKKDRKEKKIGMPGAEGTEKASTLGGTRKTDT